MSRVILLHSSDSIANEGERKTLKFLDTYLVPAASNIQGRAIGELGPEYILIPNLEIPDQSSGRYLEFDAVLIAPHAVYLIEVKDWGNTIEGDDQYWYLNGHREFKNPHLGLNHKCRVVNSLLRRYHPDLRNVWTQSMVIIARDQTELSLQGKCKDLTFKLNQPCLQFIKNPRLLDTPPDKRVRENGIAHLQQEICNALVGKSRARSGKPKIIQGYQIEEELFVDEHISEYLGFKLIGGQRSGVAKRLRVLRVPPLASKEEQGVIRKKLLRDYEALETLGSHPNIVGLKGLLDHDADQFVEVLDWSEEGTLRSVMSRRKIEPKEALEIAKGIAQGLAVIHAKGIIHRNLRPENILMTESGPQIMNFDRSYLFSPQGQTVWQTMQAPEELRYLPPELALPMEQYDFTEASDLYSLGAILYEMLCGSLPYATPLAYEQAGGELTIEQMPTRHWDKPSEQVDKIVSSLYTTHESKRLSSADAFLKAYQLAFEQPEVIVIRESSVDHVPQANDRVGDFQIINKIGDSGGFSDVYRARQILQNKLYALKINRRAMDLDALIEEFSILDQLEHEHIVKVNWSGQLPDGRFYLAMELLEGRSLREQIRQEQETTLKHRIEQASLVAKHILSALRYLHEPELKSGEMKDKIMLHRDIKPDNIMHVPDRGYILIDFNVANENSQESQQTFTGTKAYIAPDLIDPSRFEIKWDASADTFALGCTLFEVICGKHPYDYKPKVGDSPLDPKFIEGCETLDKRWRAFLLKAVQIGGERFKSAREMQDAFLQLSSDAQFLKQQAEEQALQQQFKPSAWIRFLRKYGPVPSNDNMYDESIQRALKRNKIQPLHFNIDYLDDLINNFKSNTPNSVILTGTAGDGKTFSCREVWQKLGGDHSTWETGNKTPTLKLPNGSQLVIIKDLSELDDDEGQNLLIRMAQHVLRKEHTELFLIAANDGQLMERWEKAGNQPEVKMVQEHVEDMLLGNEREKEGLNLLMINLSRLVRSAKEYTQIFDAVLKHPGWSACDTCPYQAHENPHMACPIWENRQRFSGEENHRILQERLIALFELSQLNGRHLTTRQILLLMANSLLGHPQAKEHLMSCKDVPKLIEGRKLHLASIYSNLLGSNLSVQRRESTDVFAALNHFSLGKETNNRIDNILIFGKEAEEFSETYESLVEADTYYGGHREYEALRRAYIEGELEDKEEFLTLLEDQRRRLFFVIPEDKADEMRLWNLTVFHHAGRFLEMYHQLINRHTFSEWTLFQLVKGLNRVVTGLPTSTQNELYLSSSGCYSQAKVSSVWEGVIPVSVNDEGQSVTLYMESGVPYLVVVFKYLNESENIFEKLPLQLFRFEFLMRVANGLLPGSFSNECYEDILAFKSRLLQALRKKQNAAQVRKVNPFSSPFKPALAGAFSQSSGSIALKFVALNEDGNLKTNHVNISIPEDMQA